MRASVAAAWPAFCSAYEGRCEWLYLDTKRLPTTGLGHRVFTVADMVALPWLTKDGKPATDAQKRAEWTRIGKRTDLAPKGGFAYQSVATLHLSNATVDGLLTSDTPKYWDPLVKVLPNLETWPADAQLAILDMAYNLGAFFLGSAWPNFTAAAKRGDFTGCAVFCLRAVKSARDYRHQRMFTNAATVVMLGADPETLWLDRTPSLPPDPTPTSDPTPTPGDDVPVNLRGFKVCSCVAEAFPALEQEMLRRGLIKHSIDIAQGGYNAGGVGASAGTHDKGGCIDILQYSDAQIQCAREMGWTFQHRTPAQGFSHHAHGWPLGCDHLAPAAQSQATQWRNGTNGLVSRGRIAGKYPIDDWKTALKKWKAAEKKRADDAAEAQRLKELEMPTVKELTSDKAFLAAIADAVLNADVIPNTFTSNTANENVSTKSALSLTGKRVGSIEAKIDALAAAVAATFPKPEPAPTPPAA